MDISFTIVSSKQSGLSLYRAAAVPCISALTLCGWRFDQKVFKRLIPRLAAMNAVTAVYFITYTVARYRLGHPKNESIKAAARWLVCIPLLVGLLPLVETPSGILPDVDGLLYPGMLQCESQADLLTARRATNHLTTT